ncbi:MAG: NYN domain-containing protein [Anaerolineales bacterium]
MPLLIDGHNLIGQMKEIELSDPDDEHQLIERLIEYCRRTGRRATVYFDKAAPLGRDPRPQSGLTVHFVPSASSADQAIRRHLIQLGGGAKNWTVVSSDRSVRRAARGSGASIQRSEEFARQLTAPRREDPDPEKPPPPPPEELEKWLRIFSEQDPENAD